MLNYFNHLKKMFMKNPIPNYRIIELEAENSRLNSELIESLKKNIQVLEAENSFLKSQQGLMAAHDFVEQTPEIRPRIGTISQLANLMEAASLQRKLSKSEKDA